MIKTSKFRRVSSLNVIYTCLKVWVQYQKPIKWLIKDLRSDLEPYRQGNIKEIGQSVCSTRSYSVVLELDIHIRDYRPFIYNISQRELQYKKLFLISPFRRGISMTDHRYLVFCLNEHVDYWCLKISCNTGKKIWTPVWFRCI